jgi:hypothetical protein
LSEYTILRFHSKLEVYFPAETSPEVLYNLWLKQFEHGGSTYKLVAITVHYKLSSGSMHWVCCVLEKEGTPEEVWCLYDD